MTKNANCLLCQHNINLVCEEKVHQKNNGSKPIFDDCDFLLKIEINGYDKNEF